MALGPTRSFQSQPGCLHREKLQPRKKNLPFFRVFAKIFLHRFPVSISSRNPTWVFTEELLKSSAPGVMVILVMSLPFVYCVERLAHAVVSAETAHVMCCIAVRVELLYVTESLAADWTC